MTGYQVRVSPTVHSAITEHAIYIAEQSGSESVARRWSEHVYDMFDTLRSMPDRFGFAEESGSRSYDIRRLLIGQYLAIYTIDEPSQTVWVIGFRHGGRLPRPAELPTDPPSEGPDG